MAWNPSYPSITEGLGPRHGEVRRAHQMLNEALLLALLTGARVTIRTIRYKNYSIKPIFTFTQKLTASRFNLAHGTKNREKCKNKTETDVFTRNVNGEDVRRCECCTATCTNTNIKPRRV